ncbi:MAG: CARDB domain-containing protein [Candidatus Nanoarchaeia archaeon]|jgi:hypothetical protein
MENTKLLKVMSLLASFAIILNVGFSAVTLQISSSNTNMNPDQTGYITLSVQNKGTDNAYDVEVGLNSLAQGLSSANLCTSCSYYSSDRNVCFVYRTECLIKAGTITAGETKTINIPINVADNITSDVYNADYLLRYSTVQGSTDYNSYIYLSGSHFMEIINSEMNPNLIIDTIRLSNDLINPGEKFTATLVIKNTGGETAKSPKMTLDSEVFSTYNSSNTFSLQDIPAGESVDFNVQLVSSSSDTVGSKTLTYTIDYGDYSSSGNFAIVLGGGCEFELFSKTITESSTVTAKFSLANIGLTDANSVSLRLLESSYYLIISGESYLGALESGNYGSITVELTPLREFDGTLNFEVSYTNPFGERKSVDISKKITVSSNATYASVNMNSSRPLMNDSDRFSNMGPMGMGGFGSQQQSTVNLTGILIGAGVIISSIGATIVFIIKRKHKKAKKEKENKRSD